jgi:hypothetical protein
MSDCAPMAARSSFIIRNYTNTRVEGDTERSSGDFKSKRNGQFQ